MPISACATPPGAVEITGLEQFAASCPSEPPALSDEEALALAAAAQTALRMPNDTPEQQAAQALYLNQHVITPLSQTGQDLRACALHERQRASGLLGIARAYNEAIR